MAEEMSDLIRAYIQDRANARLEKLDKEAEKAMMGTEGDPLAQEEAKASHAARRAEAAAQYHPATWLTDAAKRAKQLSFATHPVKFTNPDAKGASSVYAATRDAEVAGRWLTTAALADIAIDVGGNAAALDVAGLLQRQQEPGGPTLADQIAQGDLSALQTFAQDAAQLEDWRQGFNAALADKKASSHTLAKQIYFPTGDGGYHLLAPLFSSSLAQAQHQRITDSRFTDAAKETRKLRREGKFSDHPTVDYLNVAVLRFGGTNSQNISQLNNRRGGKAFLLSCQPPVWSERSLPALNRDNAFWQAFGRRNNHQAWRTAKALKEYLLRIVERDSTKPRRDLRAEMVDELMDALLHYAAELQHLTDQSGWSARSKLSRAEQLWLDPLRQDEGFQQERAAGDWKQEIAKQFANWLNWQLKDEKLVMKDTEYREWSKLLKRRLARLKDDLAFADAPAEALP